ncbi:MAG: ArnT family glycosyltransferase [Solirubrobacteraceae bacterium]
MTAIAPPPPTSVPYAPGDVDARPAARRGRWGLAIGGVLVLALVLRLWGVKHGLPFAYNSDENAHFVPKAIGIFGHDWNPHYFNNPPAFTYLLHIVLSVWFGGGAAVATSFRSNPTEVFVIARITAGVLGTVSVWLLYVAGSRLIDRRTGLLAAGLMAVAFLPVFYSHLALNDVPTLAPLTLSLWGVAGILRLGRLRDYAIAGIGLGVACATKYTGGIVLLPLLVAAGVQFMQPGGRVLATRGLLLAGGLALAGFLATDPYSLLDFSAFRDGLRHQSSVTDEATGKLGLTHGSGITYYLWTMTWGLGWIPALAALAGSVMLWRDERRLALLCAPAIVVFLIFMGSQGRYFGRWLIPVLPIICLLAAFAGLQIAEVVARRRPQLRPTLIALAVLALCGQALVHSVHSGLVLSRSDTRNDTRAWLVGHVPGASRIVVEPVVPDAWAQDIGRIFPGTTNGYRWYKYPATKSQVASDGTLQVGAGPAVNIEDYERTLRPELIDLYVQHGYCWVVTGSTQSGRATAAPSEVPQAIAYYDALSTQGQLVYEASPYAAGRGPVKFNFDWAFDYYPLDYAHPGPVMQVYHLSGGLCDTPQ